MWLGTMATQQRQVIVAEDTFMVSNYIALFCFNFVGT